MRKNYNKKEIKKLVEKHPYIKEFISKKTLVVDDNDKIIIDNKPLLIRIKEEWIPTLELIKIKKDLLPKIIVDKGTPPYIAKGADLMRPGIKECEEFKEGAIVTIIEETYQYPIAIGRALKSSEEIMKEEKGKMVEVIINLRTE